MRILKCKSFLHFLAANNNFENAINEFLITIPDPNIHSIHYQLDGRNSCLIFYWEFSLASTVSKTTETQEEAEARWKKTGDYPQ